MKKFLSLVLLALSSLGASQFHQVSHTLDFEAPYFQEMRASILRTLRVQYPFLTQEKIDDETLNGLYDKHHKKEEFEKDIEDYETE